MTTAGKTVLSGTFVATGQSAVVTVFGRASLTIEGGIGTVAVERSEDGGTSWVVASKNSDGDAASYTTASAMAFNGVIDEPESQILYRFNCTAYTSGNVNYRIAVG